MIVGRSEFDYLTFDDRWLSESNRICFTIVSDRNQTTHIFMINGRSESNDCIFVIIGRCGSNDPDFKIVGRSKYNDMFC